MAIDISPLTPTQLMSNYASRAQDDLEQTGIRIASGIKHQDFAGFSDDGNLERLISFDASLKELDAFLRTNNNAAARARTTEQAIDQIREAADQLIQDITSRRNSASGATVPLNLLAQGALGQIESSLNVQFDGRFLFAGTKTDTPPVQNINTSNIDTTSGFNVANSSYYRGDSNKPVARSSDTETIEYGALASDSAFQKIIGAAHLAISGHNNNDDETLKDAIDMIDQGIVEITSLRATVTTSITRITSVSRTHEDAKLLIQEDKRTISNTDIVNESARLSEREATLQAIYIALNRITRLSLANFIN